MTTDVIIFNVERCDLQYSILGMNGNVVAYGTKIDIDGEVKVPINEIPYGEYTIKVEFDGIPYMGNFVIEDF